MLYFWNEIYSWLTLIFQIHQLAQVTHAKMVHSVGKSQMDLHATVFLDLKDCFARLALVNKNCLILFGLSNLYLVLSCTQ